MQILKNKTKLTATIVIILLMISAFTIMLNTPAQAQEYTNQYINQGSIPLPAGVTPDIELETFAHLSFRPNPVGFGQNFLIKI